MKNTIRYMCIRTEQPQGKKWYMNVPTYIDKVVRDSFTNRVPWLLQIPAVEPCVSV